eukprot:scaffold9437_cov72-Isochrysis_galbana.AAC.2
MNSDSFCSGMIRRGCPSREVPLLACRAKDASAPTGSPTCSVTEIESRSDERTSGCDCGSIVALARVLSGRTHRQRRSERDWAIGMQAGAGKRRQARALSAPLAVLVDESHSDGSRRSAQDDGDDAAGQDGRHP